MRWLKKSEHIDKRMGKHVVILHEPESGAEHHVVILLNNLPADFDVKARVNEEIAKQQRLHDDYEAHAKKHRVPVLTADGKTRAAR